MRSRFPAFLTLFVFVIVSAHAGEYVNEGDEVYDASATPSTAGIFDNGYDNRGTVTAIGGTEGSGSSYTSGIYISGGFTNSGTVTAIAGTGGDGQGRRSGIYIASGGFTNSGTVTATGGTRGGVGIYVSSGNFTNSGTVTATGGTGHYDNNGRGNGIYVQSGNFTNSGTVTATGGTSGGSVQDSGNSSGIYASTGFTNSGTVTATGGTGGDDFGSGSGIFVFSGDFINSGRVTATGGTAGSDSGSGSGIFVHSGRIAGTNSSFTNNGTLTLASGGNTAAVCLTALRSDNYLKFEANSTLELAGGYIYMRSLQLFFPGTTIVSIDQTAQLVSLSASALGVGDSPLTHTQFIRNGDSSSTNWANDFIVPGAVEISSGVYKTATLTYTLYNTVYTVDVERTAQPSSLASGNGASALADLEAGLVGALSGTNNDQLDSDYLTYAQRLSAADHQPTAAGVRKIADAISRESTPQATANAIPMLVDATRGVGDDFRLRLEDALLLDCQDPARVGRALSARSGGAFARLADQAKPAFLVWGSPYYHNARQHGGDGHSRLKQDVVGATIGIAVSRGDWSFAAAGHYLHADLGGSREYAGKGNAGGFNLGLTKRFPASGLRLSLAGGWTRYDLDQTRRETIPATAKYHSSTDLDVFTASLFLTRPFGAGCWNFAPRAGLDYAHARADDYREKSKAVAATPMRVSADEYNSFRGIAGATFSYRLARGFSVEVRGDYHFEFADTEAFVTGRDAAGLPFVFATKGRDQGRHSARFGAGFRVDLTDRAFFRADYDFRLAKHYRGHGVSAAVGVRF